jgi:NO-binding membrane sensor protein with MHYT domain
MHYVGVSAMHIQDGYITWNLWLVALSYLIAYVDTLLANSCLLGSEQRISRQIVFGAVAATGIFAMHFTGQAAATFHSSAAPGTGGSNVPIFLIIMIAASAVATCLVSNIVLAHVTATTRDRIIETVITKRRLWRVMAQKEAAESANSLKSDCGSTRASCA